jgi:hypothetical protein
MTAPDNKEIKKRPKRDAPKADAPEVDVKPDEGEDYPAAGPHAKPELTNRMATPGAGALADPDGDGDAQNSTG